MRPGDKIAVRIHSIPTPARPDGDVIRSMLGRR